MVVGIWDHDRNGYKPCANNVEDKKRRTILLFLHLRGLVGPDSAPSVGFLCSLAGKLPIVALGNTNGCCYYHHHRYLYYFYCILNLAKMAVDFLALFVAISFGVCARLPSDQFYPLSVNHAI